MKTTDSKRQREPLVLVKYSVLFLFILLQIYLIFLKKHDTLDLDVYPNTTPTQLIYGRLTVGQTFFARSDNLCRVDIMMGTLDRQNDRDLVFELWEFGQTNEILRSTTVNTSRLLNNLYNSFTFKPVRKSKNREFAFILSSPTSWPENSVCAWMNHRNIYKRGSVLLNDAAGRGDLVFRVYSKRPISTELHRIVRNYPGIFGKTWFLILSILLFEGASFLMLIKLLDLLISSVRGNRI
ncbi:MAG: hypothetical protein QHH14_13395 [Clostridiales bacterium]|nr:hypothetical protein [Clostridiales bacterium]